MEIKVELPFATLLHINYRLWDLNYEEIHSQVMNAEHNEWGRTDPEGGGMCHL